MQVLLLGAVSHPFARLRTSLKLARTIADLGGSGDINSVHLAEALPTLPPSEVDDGNSVASSGRTQRQNNI